MVPFPSILCCSALQWSIAFSDYTFTLWWNSAPTFLLSPVRSCTHSGVCSWSALKIKWKVSVLSHEPRHCLCHLEPICTYLAWFCSHPASWPYNENSAQYLLLRSAWPSRRIPCKRMVLGLLSLGEMNHLCKAMKSTPFISTESKYIQIFHRWGLFEFWTNCSIDALFMLAFNVIWTLSYDVLSIYKI